MKAISYIVVCIKYTSTMKKQWEKEENSLPCNKRATEPVVNLESINE